MCKIIFSLFLPRFAINGKSRIWNESSSNEKYCSCYSFEVNNRIFFNIRKLSRILPLLFLEDLKKQVISIFRSLLCDLFFCNNCLLIKEDEVRGDSTPLGLSYDLLWVSLHQKVKGQCSIFWLVPSISCKNVWFDFGWSCSLILNMWNIS